MTPSCYAQCKTYVTDFAPSRDYIFGSCFKWCVCDIPTSHLGSGVNNFGDKNRNGTQSELENSSCTVWTTQGKYFFHYSGNDLRPCPPPPIPFLVGLVREKSSLIANGQTQFLSRNNKTIIWVKCVSRCARSLRELFPSVLLFLQVHTHFTNTAGTILAALLSERRAIGRGALRNHPGAELGTGKKKNPVNLSDTLACVQTKRMLTHRHNWRDHAVPAFPPARQFPSLHSCAGKLSHREMTKTRKQKSQSQ